MRRSIFFVINPISGVRKNKQPLKHLIQQTLSPNKIELYETTGRGDAFRSARTARERAFDLIVAVGGDGTVNEVASALCGGGIPLGILPAGSGNGLARSLGIPLNLKLALQMLLQFHTKRIDIGKAGDRFFCNAAGLGLDAEVAFRFDRTRRRGLLGYSILTAMEFFQFAPFYCSVSLDGNEIEARPFLLAFANSYQYGNGAIIAPQAQLDDGYLDLCLVEDISKMRMLAAMPRLFVGTLDRDPKVKYHKFKRATITMDGPIRYHVDGEPVATHSSLTVEIIPAALSVCVPANRTKQQ